MNNACHDNLYFGDLHFHTHYSDNRDRASIEEMIIEGAQYHLSIFGTADHNHNLDAEKWRQTQEETKALRKKYPEFLLLNNYEITFLLGHLNVLTPENIEGTVVEGYRYLYLDSKALKVINHPFPTHDEWHRRIIPDAIGVEVINGSVFTHAKEEGYHIHSAIDIPSVHTYATYLALELPVAAIGGSDAHRKAEMGYGMTGFWIADKPDSQSVIEAIRGCRTFATTNSAIILDWYFNEAEGELSWKIAWKKHGSPLNVERKIPPNTPLQKGRIKRLHSNNNFTVEIYFGTQKIQTAYGNGTLAVEKEGLYWIAVFDEGDIAVSSPITIRGRKHIEKNTSHKESILKEAIQSIRTDLTWLNMKEENFSQPIVNVFSEDVEIPVIFGTDYPQIVDASGKNVPYEVISRGSSRVIIDKECGVRDFDEFYLWLERNEIHEYVFVKIEYCKVDHTFFFSGHLLPKKMVHREDIETRYRSEIRKIRKLIDEQMKIKIHVSTLPPLVIKIHLESKAFPYRIFDDFTGMDSLFSYIGEDVECPVHILDHVKKIRYDGRKPLQERIYQIFV